MAVILIVEDDAFIHEYVEIIVQELGTRHFRPGTWIAHFRFYAPFSGLMCSLPTFV